jgi:DNA-binding MarR family transcriptional regulator
MATRRGARLPLAALRRHEPEELLTFRISVLSQLLSRVVEQSVGAQLGLSSRQWRVLVMLNRLGPSTSGQVAAATRLDHSQVSRASHELADKGLIDMHSDAEDRRRQRLAVTADGMAVLRQGIVGSQARQARLRGCLGDAQYDAFGTALQALTAEAQAMLEETRGSAPREW